MKAVGGENKTMAIDDIHDRDGDKLLLFRVKGRLPRVKLIWADDGYAGKLIKWVVTKACHLHIASSLMAWRYDAAKREWRGKLYRF